MDEFKVLLKAVVDAEDTQAQLNAINNLSVKIEKLNLDQSAITELRNQLSKSGIDVNLVLGNTNQIQNQAKQTGQQIGNLVSDSAEKVISGISSKNIGKYFRIDPSTSKEFENEIKSLVSQWTNAKGEMTDLKIDTRTVYDKDADASFERLHQATVTYKNDLDEVIKKIIAWRQTGTTIDTEGNEVAIRGFVEVAGQYSKALEKASIASDTFADKQLKVKSSLSDSLNSIKSSVADTKAPKPIKDQANISSLQTQYQIVEQAIVNVGTASKSNFAQMESDARTQISALQDMVRQYRNAENVATSLRTKDIATVKDVEVQKLQEFKDKIAGSNVSITQMQEDLNNLDTALNNAFDATALTSYLNQLDVTQAKFKQLNTQITSANRNEKVQIKVDGLRSNIDEFSQLGKKATDFKTVINGVEVSVQSLTADLSNVKSQGDFSVINEKWKAFEQAAKSAGIQVENTISITKKISDINKKIGSNTYDANLATLKASYEKLGLTSEEVAQKTEKVSEALVTLKSSNVDSLIANEERFNTELKKSQNEATILKTHLDQIYNPNKQFRLSTDIQNWLHKNTGASKTAKRSLEEYYRELSGGRVPVDRLEYIEKQLKTIDSQQRGLGKLGKSLKDQMSQAATSFSQWVSVSSVIMAIIYQLKKMPHAVYEVDTAMTNLYKVTDETKAKYNSFLDTSNKKAQELGRSVSSLIEQSADWAKLGFNIDESAKLAEYSSIYSNVGEVDDTTAVSDMVTAMKAFNITADDSIKIIDSYNKLGNEFATSASALALAGNDIDQSLAMITGMTEITQNASESGNAVKILSMRLRGMKGDLEELGEDTEGIESISKIQTQLLNLSDNMVNIFDNQENFKSTYEIMSDIAKVWDKMSQVDQAQMLEIIAGKQRGNSIAALIQSFQSGQVDKALAASMESAGSAMQEQERWMGSLEAKTQQLNAAFQGLSQTILGSDLIKFFVDFGINGVQAITSVTKTLKSLGTIGLGAGLFAGIKNVGINTLVAY